MVKKLTLIILLAGVLICSDALFSWGSLRFSRKNDHQYLARFAVDQDSIFTARARVRLADPYRAQMSSPLKVLLMNDMEWDIALESEDCTHRESLARFTVTPILSSNGMWSKWEQTRISIKNRPQVWYIFMADGSRQTHGTFDDLPRIEYEIEMLNDDSQFSHEQKGLMTISFLTLILYCYLLFKSERNLRIQIKGEGRIESPLAFLAVAIYLELLNLLFTGFHLYVYWYNGYGFWWMEYIATICEVLSQASIVSLIVLIAFGWTLTYDYLSQQENYIMVIMLNILIHFAIAVLTIVDDGEHHKYHDFEGIQGFILVLIRFGFFGILVWKIRDTNKKMPDRHKGFLKGFAISASIYILAFPVCYFISYLLNPHMRMKFIVYSNIIAQTTAILILINQILKKKSGYYQASKNSQPILGAKNK